MCVLVCVRVRVRASVFICEWVHAYAFTCVCVRAFLCVCMFVFLCSSEYACVCLCVRECLWG